MGKKLAVYAGSFDPLTLGHLWVIEQAAEVFEQLIVAIGTNPQKHCMFSAEERLEMIQKSTAHLRNVQIDSYPNRYLIKYAQSVGARFIIRGIRSEKDYKDERDLGDFNSKIDPSITTIFLIPPQGIADVSSSRVKELIGPEGWEDIMKMYVPDPVLEKLKEIRRGK
ncbi:MAG: pantetheine-phosphate adenylyltransferase [bacterium]|nr:pantetheine-phosphate adenylyltransferase [bacterium]